MLKQHILFLFSLILLLLSLILFIIDIIIIITFIIIIILKSCQWKARIEPFTTYQSEDPWPTIPTCRKKEEKGKTVEDKKRVSL